MEVTAPKGDFVNGTTSKTITISNTGATDVTITSVEFTGANADEFTTTASPTTIGVGKNTNLPLPFLLKLMEIK